LRRRYFIGSSIEEQNTDSEEYTRADRCEWVE
jgi:hypothetical protein